MIALLLSAALAAEPTAGPVTAVPTDPAPALPVDAVPAEASPKKKGWFSSIRYGVGFGSSFGGGTDGTVFGRSLVVEPLTFELRSFLHPKVAFHTTLNLGRMIAPAIQSKDGRIDYGCHLGVHAPVGQKLTLVVAPGADIAYSFTHSRYQRIVGDVRLGLDVVHGAWTTGFYVRPYGGWWRDVGEEHGRAVGGALFEMVNVYIVPKKAKKARHG
jgi:hypothetical protein